MTLSTTLQHFLIKIFYAEIKYSFHDGSGFDPTIVFIQKAPTGCCGFLFNFNLVSVRSLSALIKLHFLQQATTLSQICSPPLDLGTMWSTDSACAPQY